MKTVDNNSANNFSKNDIEKLSAQVNWKKKGMEGMIPVSAQDINTKEILMQAYVNKEAFENTLKSGNATYRSRSRNELWEKGLTSGATQEVYDIKIDCDRDSIIYIVKQLGEVGACHIDGQNSCFETDSITLRNNTKQKIGDVLDSLYSTLEQRKKDYEMGQIGPEESYTVKLLSNGVDDILKKVGEEVIELLLGVKNNDMENAIYELSDLIYFLNVFMIYSGIKPYEIANELLRRFGMSGLEEKKNRGKS